MCDIKLALIGFGNVGQGFTTILRDRGSLIANQTGCNIVITAVSDTQKGSIADPSGLSPADLLETMERTGRIDGLQAAHRGWDALTTIQRAEADVIVELSFTDLETAEPATSHIREALNRGRHVITTNKGPIALHFGELSRLAQERKRMLRFEGTVMSGTPVLRAGQQLLASAGVRRIKGILNGTTNYVLMRMESGYSYSSALAEAQKLGYAEANPVGDIEGHDSVAKLIILAQVFFGQTIRASDVSREGITQVSAERIAGALESGERWKLVASLWREGERLRATVLPERLSLTHPLAGVGGATNAICFDTELLGAVTMAGPGAGRIPTGYAVLSDLLAIAGK